jgi:hypothetical protein
VSFRRIFEFCGLGFLFRVALREHSAGCGFLTVHDEGGEGREGGEGHESGINGEIGQASSVPEGRQSHGDENRSVCEAAAARHAAGLWEDYPGAGVHAGHRLARPYARRKLLTFSSKF